MSTVKKSLPLVLLLSIVILGCFLVILSSVNASNLEKGALFGLFFGNNVGEVASPADRIKESQIHVYENQIVIDLPHASWATFVDTNSMDPMLDIEANSIEIKPESADAVQVGDIISYRSEYVDGVIVHRVIEKGEDSEGVYFIARGDNNSAEDPGKIRFEQIVGVLVAVIY